MIKVKNLLAISLFLVLLASCNKASDCGFQPSDVLEKITLDIERLEATVLGLDSREAIATFIEKEPLIADLFLLREEYPNDEIFISEILQRNQSPHIDSLLMEIQKTYGDLSSLKQELEDAFTYFHHYYPEHPLPKIKTIATGFDYDLYISDTLIVIGLDYYMGPDAKYRPAGTYNYILKRYEQKYIVPSIMLLYGISSDINAHDDKDATILSDIVSYGKAFYFAKRMMPCTADSTLIWYDSQEFEGATNNQDIVWGYFIEKNLLFETSHLVKRKYIDERPKTFEIGPDCPARIGTWLGWKIVNKYMDEYPELSLQELMEIADARKVLEGSKYRPN